MRIDYSPVSFYTDVKYTINFHENEKESCLVAVNMILLSTNLTVIHDIFILIGQMSFNPEFIRQTQHSVLSWTHKGSAQINIANIRVLKETTLEYLSYN